MKREISCKKKIEPYFEEGKTIKMFKDDIYWILVIMIFFMTLHLVGINMFTNGFSLGFLIVFNLSNIIRYLISKDKNKKQDIIGTLLLPFLLLINFYLFDMGIYIPAYIVVLIGIGLTYIYYLNRLNIGSKLRKIGFLCILLIGFFSIDYYMYSNRLLKDVNFNRLIKKELNIEGSMHEDDLKGIDRLYISSKYKVNDLKGIEHFEDLKTLYISDGNLIKDYTPLTSLVNLEKLTLCYIDLKQLDKLTDLESLQSLEIIYPKKGILKNLNNFQNLKELEIQGLEIENLNLLSGPKHLEKLGLADIPQISFEGIDQFSELRELRLYKLNVRDVKYLFKLSNLEEISIQGCDIEDYEEIRNWTKENGIKVEVIEPFKLRF